jgi:hypothetical protein
MTETTNVSPSPAPGLAERLRRLAGTQASPRATLHHYLRMALRNHREYLQGPEVRLKKYRSSR